MLTVYKYPLPVADVVELTMPQGAEVLFVAVQGEMVCLWARVESNAPTETRHFRIAGTGHRLTSDVGQHLGSFLLHGGALVFHVFELNGP